MTELVQLPARPAGINTLTNPEADRLEALHPDVPRSPENCVTCLGALSFQWWDYYVEGHDPEDPKVVRYECNCVDQYITHRRLLYCGIDKNQQRYCWPDMTGVPARTKELVETYLSRAERYVNNGRSLFLYGDRGTGKSMLATMLAKHLIGEGYSSHFTTFAGMIGRFSEGWESPDARQWFQRRIRNVGFLVIDDIGKEHQQGMLVNAQDAKASGYDGPGRIKFVNPIAESLVNDILGDRVAGARPTIITSNLNLDEIAQHYGPRISELIRESSITHRFDAESFREGLKHRVTLEDDLDLTRPVVLR
jgi:DNA replication protein DnaC